MHRAVLSADQARRLVLSAQGFTARRAADRAPGAADVRRLARRVHVFQLDPISVVVRTQYMPAFSRLGSYPRNVLDRLAYDRSELFEFYGHQASLVSIELHPLLRWRMDAFAGSPHWADSLPRAFVDSVLGEIEARGPLAGSELPDVGRRGRYAGGWSWSDRKRALTWLHLSGRLAVAGRRGIEQRYDLAERVIPATVLDAPAVDVDDARRELLVHAARALGVATATDLADYFAIDGFMDRRAAPRVQHRAGVPELLADLVETGRLVPTEVDGWRDLAYTVPGARIPRVVGARALLSPFDSLIWERRRLKRLFDFEYRVEIYVPPTQRVHGYYVLPFLLGDRLVARVDVKADRKHSVLRVLAAYAENVSDRAAIAPDLAAELHAMASWLDLDRVEVARRGDLAPALRAVT